MQKLVAERWGSKQVVLEEVEKVKKMELKMELKLELLKLELVLEIV